jgi:hypothetical protein
VYFRDTFPPIFKPVLFVGSFYSSLTSPPDAYCVLVNWRFSAKSLGSDRLER